MIWQAIFNPNYSEFQIVEKVRMIDNFIDIYAFCQYIQIQKIRCA